MKDNSRTSFMSFCKKYNAGYIEYDVKHHRYPYYSKFFICNVCINYDFVIYLDADMIVMDDAPNLFEELDKNKFNVVKETFKNNTSWLVKEYKDDPFPIADRLLQKKLDYKSYSDYFFNSGFIGFNPKIAYVNFMNLQNILHEVDDTPNKHNIWGILEQSLINYELISTNLINPVSIKYNDYYYLNNSYIYHFTGDYLTKDKIESFSYTR